MTHIFVYKFDIKVNHLLEMRHQQGNRGNQHCCLYSLCWFNVVAFRKDYLENRSPEWRDSVVNKIFPLYLTFSWTVIHFSVLCFGNLICDCSSPLFSEKKKKRTRRRSPARYENDANVGVEYICVNCECVRSAALLQCWPQCDTV